MMITGIEINVTATIISLLLIYSISLAGAVTKDVLDTILGRCTQLQLKKDICSSLTSAMIMYGLSDIIIAKFGFKPFIALSYIMGLISFEILMKLSTLRGITNLIKDFQDFRNFNNSRFQPEERDNET